MDSPAADELTPPASPEPAATWRSSRISHVAILAALVAAVYARTLDVPFVLDDIGAIGANPALRSVDAWLAAGGWRDARFVSFFSFAVDGSLHGGSLAGLHATNILVHLAATLLVYALVSTLFRTPALAGSCSAASVAASGRLVALGAAALFAAHPLQIQAVTYLIQRMASLAGALYLASTVAYLRARLARGRARWGWLAASLAAFLAGLFTKQHVATLPAALLLLEVALFGGRARTRLGWLAPHWLVAGLLVGSRLSAAKTAASTAVEARSVGSAVGPWEYLSTQLRVLVEYLRMLALPVGQNIDHQPRISRTILEPQALASLALLLALASAGAWLLATARRRDGAWRLVGAGILWWFVTHAVESSVLPISDVMVEHRVYLPSVGIFLTVATAGALAHAWLSGRAPAWRHVPAAAIAVVTMAFAGAAVVRNEVWRDPVALWADAARKAPSNARAHNNLGAQLLVRGRVVEAIAAFAASAQANPSFAPAYYGLSQAYAAAGQRALSERYKAEAYRLGAAHQLALGEGLIAAGAWGQAAVELGRAAIGAPSDGRIRRSLGLALLGSGNARRALAELELATRLSPNDAEAHLALSRALRELGRREDADRALAAATRLDPAVAGRSGAE